MAILAIRGLKLVIQLDEHTYGSRGRRHLVFLVGL